MSCHAPNDKLLPDGLSIEMYYCELEFGHKGPHKCSGYGPWYDDSYHEANDYVSKAAAEAAQPPDLDLTTRALKAMLPADAAELADELAQDADKLEAAYESSYGPVPLVSKLRRAAAILRGEA